MRNIHEFLKISIGPFLIAGVIGIFILFIAFNHNPQGEFVENGNVVYVNVIPLFLIWFVPIFLTLEIAFVLFFKKNKIDLKPRKNFTN